MAAKPTVIIFFVSRRFPCKNQIYELFIVMVSFFVFLPRNIFELSR